MGLKKYDIHKLMLDHQMATAWELLDSALAYESIGGHLMAEMLLFKACDVELIAFGVPPVHFPRARTFDEYVDKEVKWLPKLQRPTLPEKAAVVQRTQERPMPVLNTLYKEKPKQIGSDYISFGRLAGSLLRVS